MNSLYDPDQFSDEEYIELFSKYIIKTNPSGIEAILTDEDNTKHYPLTIDWSNLLQYNSQLGHLIVTFPLKLLPLFDESIIEVQQAILSIRKQDEKMSLKSNCHARITGLNFIGIKKATLPRSSSFGHLVGISGTVIRTGSIKMFEEKKDVRCSKCKERFSINADLEQEGNPFPRVIQCKGRSKDKPCPSKLFEDIESSAQITNYQEIKIQEPMQSLAMGSIPRSIIVVLKDDLADLCQPGDDVTITGIVLRRWRPTMEGERCNLQTFMVANHLLVNNERHFSVHITEELKSEFSNYWNNYYDNDLPNNKLLYARDQIVKSVCPQIYGMYYVKLAFLLVLIGGKQEVTANGQNKVRGECHMLLVGEPGTGKSQFLKYAAKLGQRSVLTTGTGSSSAGLTVTAVKDKGGEWILEAGALVLSDGGVCCIDEFNCIKPQDKATIHEAMEQQTLSVAKAGLVCKLNSRCTIIAACNPKGGGYDENEDISVNLAIASPLLSRFDLIMILHDKKDLDWDRRVSSFILNGHNLSDINSIDDEEENEKPSLKVKKEKTNEGVSTEGFNSSGSNFSSSSNSNDDDKKKIQSDLWTLEQLKSYIAFVKSTIHPEINHEAQQILMAYYRKQRSADLRNQARTTIRLLESMVRLTQAHARLMFKQTAEIQDAIFAIILMECSLNCTSLDSALSALHSTFPADPDLLYPKQEMKILKKLGLEHLCTSSTPPPSSVSSSPPALHFDFPNNNNNNNNVNKINNNNRKRNTAINNNNNNNNNNGSISSYFNRSRANKDEEEDDEKSITDFINNTKNNKKKSNISNNNNNNSNIANIANISTSNDNDVRGDDFDEENTEKMSTQNIKEHTNNRNNFNNNQNNHSNSKNKNNITNNNINNNNNNQSLNKDLFQNQKKNNSDLNKIANTIINEKEDKQEKVPINTERVSLEKTEEGSLFSRLAPNDFSRKRNHNFIDDFDVDDIDDFDDQTPTTNESPQTFQKSNVKSFISETAEKKIENSKVVNKQVFSVHTMFSSLQEENNNNNVANDSPSRQSPKKKQKLDDEWDEFADNVSTGCSPPSSVFSSNPIASIAVPNFSASFSLPTFEGIPKAPSLSLHSNFSSLIGQNNHKVDEDIDDLDLDDDDSSSSKGNTTIEFKMPLVTQKRKSFV